MRRPFGIFLGEAIFHDSGSRLSRPPSSFFLGMETGKVFASKRGSGSTSRYKTVWLRLIVAPQRFLSPETRTWTGEGREKTLSKMFFQGWSRDVLASPPLGRRDRTNWTSEVISSHGPRPSRHVPRLTRSRAETRTCTCAVH